MLDSEIRGPLTPGWSVLLLDAQMSAAAQGKAVCFQSQRHNGEVPYLSRSQCSKEK